ncbi:hypothetical protein ABW19_dt0210634 [Dactylella cylindrospora]|nr:hypothetical protein ABW19_dt0210634 [Dactylella cylindrospora]
MISHPDDSDDGLLGESTYEILSDLSIPSHSDDEDDLSSLASLAEDNEDEDEDEDEEEQVEFTFPSPSTELPKESTTEEASNYADSVPDVPDVPGSPGIPSYTGLDRHELPPSRRITSDDDLIQDPTIKFNDDNVPLGEQTSLSFDVHEFKGLELKDVCSALSVSDRIPNLHSVLRCSLSTDALSIRDTFRVLYIGNELVKEEIIRKLGAALVVHSTTGETVEDSKSSDRFNVVPITSFGNTSATPEVELVESFGMEMAVDTCASAASVSDGKGRDLLTLVIKPRMMIRSIRTSSGCKLEAPGWRLPHLAVIFCGADDDLQQRQTRSYARAFMVRHGVPFITISESKLYTSSEEFQVDHRIIHLALESRRTDENGVRLREVYKELPIDLQSYLHVDVQQLSRNLAIVVKQEDDDNRRSSGDNSPEILKRLAQGINELIDNGMSEQNISLILVILLGVFLSSVCLGLSIILASFVRPAANIHALQPSVLPIANSLTTTTQVSSSLSVCSSKPSVKLETPKHTPISSASIPVSSSTKTSTSTLSKSTSTSITAVSTISTSVTSLSLTDLPSLPTNESNEFTMYTISDGSIVLRSPRKFAALRKAPALIVNVKRRKQTVPVEVSKLFRGVYAVKMDLNEAWGLLNITIRTESKPVINQSFILDLGSPWLSKLAWKRSVLATSSDLKKAVDRASLKAKKHIDMAKKDAEYLQKEAAKFQEKFSKHSQVARKTLESQLKYLKDGLDDLKLDEYFNAETLKEYTKQLDTKVEKARRNANRLWKRGIEVSSKDKKADAKAKKRTSGCGAKKGQWKKSWCKGRR